MVKEKVVVAKIVEKKRYSVQWCVKRVGIGGGVAGAGAVELRSVRARGVQCGSAQCVCIVQGQKGKKTSGGECR